MIRTRAAATMLVAAAVALLAGAAEATDETDPFAQGAVLLVGFLLVGGVAAYVAARLARKSRDRWDD